MTPDDYGRMHRHAIRRAHAMLPPQEVEDAAQHAMVGVVRAARRLDPGRDPWPLLTKVVRQELTMYARQYYSTRETALYATLPDFYEAPVSPEGSGLSGPLRAVLDGLPADQREVAIEYIAEGRSAVAAAQIIGVSDVTVHNRWKRALPALQKALEAA